MFSKGKTSRRPDGRVLTALGLVALIPTAARAQTQDLFVSNGNTISRFAGTGPGEFAATATTLTDPSLNSVQGLAFDAHGDLFAADNGSSTITEFVAGITPGTFGATRTLTDPSLHNPLGLALDSHGDLFVANKTAITEFAAGATPGTFGAVTSLTDPSLVNLQGLAADAHGDLFATNPFRNTIAELPAGATPGTFEAGVTRTDPSLGTPQGLAFDARGDMFAANRDGTGSITEFTVGTGTTTILTGGGLDAPQGLAVDALGDLFVANPNSGGITKFGSTGAGTFGAGKNVEGGLIPRFLAFGPSAPVPEASTTVSLGLLLALGLSGIVGAARRKKA